MAALVALFEGAGCRDVRTYIQSGNVVFDASPALAGRVGSVVEAGLLERLGVGSPVVIRTAPELSRVSRARAFEGADERHLHVMFLREMPTPAAVRSLDPDRSAPDEFIVDGREIYLRLPQGVARSKLTNAYFDRALGTVSTGRNWRTVRALAEMASG